MAMSVVAVILVPAFPTARRRSRPAYNRPPAPATLPSGRNARYRRFCVGCCFHVRSVAGVFPVASHFEKGERLRENQVMTFGKRARWNSRGIALVSIGLIVLSSALLLVLNRQGLGVSANVAQLVAVALALPGVIALLIGWRQGFLRREAPTSTDLADTESVLAWQVEVRLRNELESRLLYDPGPMPVRWRFTVDARLMDRNPGAQGEGEAEFGGSDVEIEGMVERFLSLPFGRLAIVGGEGAGKTTLAFQLALGLLHSRSDGDPIPVPLSMDGWDPGAYTTLNDWLIHRLRLEYPNLKGTVLGGRAAEYLVERGAILPVLDGFDELPREARSSAVVSLNRSMRGSRPLILTSRRDEFLEVISDTESVLSSTAVVMPRILRLDDVACYLDRCLRTHRQREQWEPVLASLRSSPRSRGERTPFQQIAGVPLWLWLVRSVYLDSGADPTPLLGKGRFATREALEEELLERVVEATVAVHRDRGERYGKETLPFLTREGYDVVRVHDRLEYLAWLLRHAALDGRLPQERELAWWQAGLLAFPEEGGWWSRVRFRGFLGALMGLHGFVFGFPVFALLGLWKSGPENVLPGALLGALLLGGVNAILNTVSLEEYLSWSKKGPGYANVGISGRARELVQSVVRKSARAVLVSCFMGIWIGSIAGMEYGFRVGLSVGATVIFGMVVFLSPVLGFLGGLFEWMEKPIRGGRMVSPRSSLRQDRVLNLVRGASWGVALGACLGLLSWLSPEVGPGLAIASFTFCAYLFGVRSMVGGKEFAAWPSYLVATCRFAYERRFPRNLMAFLDDLRVVGLLRAVGPVYRFRHARLQDHLAAAYERKRSARGERTNGPLEAEAEGLFVGGG
ncbi:hypothetical protein ABZ631_11810 [Nocardiopsis alba]|uniref:hypothetical protein n=1 Tax=Nocardiopsis alba TaxID=53437 RepID=UPI0033C75E2C